MPTVLNATTASAYDVAFHAHWLSGLVGAGSGVSFGGFGAGACRGLPGVPDLVIKCPFVNATRIVTKVCVINS